MRLVIEYTCGDGYTWHATCTVPIEYESAEAFAVDFERECHKYKAMHYEFDFAGKKWCTDDFFYAGRYEPSGLNPDILTVDEWFSRT